ncbi:hypothetical protein CDEST_01277 [Colletotrichum destructivum]|uniref:BZIP domain-containing protein n=1 Tax=Colletotrichum destructivum TaxID=34406 RepID=A0AAX4HYK8_9PEZI|nr:hypothetical protein CDEST_01277 [Colletotrichum destructivum]
MSEQNCIDHSGPRTKNASRGHQLQTDKPAKATRIRDNQRRSRARRKELINELQRKVQEYERQGIEASLPMQTGASEVAAENSRLRALLASRGLSNEQVDSHLKTFDHDKEGSAARSATTTMVAVFNTAYPDEPLRTRLPLAREHLSKTFQTQADSWEQGSLDGGKLDKTLLPSLLTLTRYSVVRQSSPPDWLALLLDASPKHPSYKQSLSYSTSTHCTGCL